MAGEIIITQTIIITMEVAGAITITIFPQTNRLNNRDGIRILI